LSHLASRTAGPLLILNLVHLLRTGLAGMVLLHLRVNRGVTGPPDPGQYSPSLVNISHNSKPHSYVRSEQY
jgi:hypothetical protein